MMGTPKKTFKSSAVTNPCPISTASLSSSQIVDRKESAFCFSLLDKHGLLEAGVGISSTEVASKAILAVLVLETMGVMETVEVTEGAFLVMRIVLFPMLDNSSSFFHLIFTYMSLLNLVVISTKRKTLVKKNKNKPKYIQENRY